MLLQDLAKRICGNKAWPWVKTNFALRTVTRVIHSPNQDLIVLMSPGRPANNVAIRQSPSTCTKRGFFLILQITAARKPDSSGIFAQTRSALPMQSQKNGPLPQPPQRSEVR